MHNYDNYEKVMIDGVSKESVATIYITFCLINYINISIVRLSRGQEKILWLKQLKSKFPPTISLIN
jgi:hypothetical protein